MVSEESLRQKIEGRREAIRKLDRERDKLAGEVAAFEEILAEMKSSTATGGRIHHAEIVESFGVGDRASGTRGLSLPWKATIKRLSREQSFNYDDVVSAAAKSEMQIEKPTARSRIFGYIDSGYVERIEDGIFRVTQKGREASE